MTVHSYVAETPMIDELVLLHLLSKHIISFLIFESMSRREPLSSPASFSKSVEDRSSHLASFTYRYESGSYLRYIDARR